MKAAIKAAETIDSCLKRITNHVINNQCNMIITADHGNLEKMYNEETKKPHTAHTCNPVPCILVSNNKNISTTQK